MTADLNVPDFTTDTATEYKTAIDEGFQNIERTGWSFAAHPANPTPNMTVDLNPGAIWSAGALIEKASQTTSTFTAPSVNPRIDRIVVDEVTGNRTTVAGSEAASPTAPAIPAGKFPICQIQFETTTTSIGYVATSTVAAIVDERISFVVVTDSDAGVPTGFINGLETANAVVDLLHDIKFEAGSCYDDTLTEHMVLSADLRKSLDASWTVGTGGGLDTGSIAADKWYYKFIIKRTDTGVVDAVFSLSSTAPTMPANFNKKRLIGAIKTKTGAAEIELYTQTGDVIEWFSRHEDYNGVGVIAGALVTVTVPVLPVVAHMQMSSLSAAGTYHTLHSPDHENVAAGTTNFDLFGGDSVLRVMHKTVPSSTGQVRHRDTTTDNIKIWTNGFTLDRGNI